MNFADNRQMSQDHYVKHGVIGFYHDLFYFIFKILYIFTPPLQTSRMQHKVNFKQSLAGLNSDFSFSSTEVKTSVCPTHIYS